MLSLVLCGVLAQPFSGFIVVGDGLSEEFVMRAAPRLDARELGRVRRMSGTPDNWMPVTAAAGGWRRVRLASGIVGWILLEEGGSLVELPLSRLWLQRDDDAGFWRVKTLRPDGAWVERGDPCAEGSAKVPPHQHSARQFVRWRDIGVTEEARWRPADYDCC